MKWKELKKRATLAIEAMKGAPLVYDYPIPKLVIESQPVQTIQANFEVSRQEADMVGHVVMDKLAKRKLLENLVKGLDNAGLVQVFQRNTAIMIEYRARIRALQPYEEE